MKDTSVKPANNVPDLSPIQDFYTNTNVFITGATGFYGKVLLEKLLRSCSTISKVYVLIRNKRNIDPKARLLQIFDDVLFERLKKERPNFYDKVNGIGGDLLMPGLGISPENRQILIDEINVIFHVAATVNFDESLSTAILVNARGTRDLLHLAHQMSRLKVIMYVSTAYSNCNRDVTEERVYSPLLDSKAVISLAENLPKSTVENMTNALLQDFPNTYVFTKHISEAIIFQDGCNLPIGIQRPATVTSTYREPIKGWINNINGPTGFVVNMNLGLLRTVQADLSANANLVPVDMCINSLIASASDVGNTFQKSKEEGKVYQIPIYNYESNSDKPVTWGYFSRKSKEYGFNYPSVHAIWYSSLNTTQYYLTYRLLRFILQTIPAIIFDAARWCGGKSLKLVMINSKINKYCEIVSHFTMRSLTYKSYNVRRLFNQMSEKDKKIFFFDLKELNWEEYLENYVSGIRLFIYKESMDSLPDAKEKNKRLYWAHQFTKLVIYIILLRVIWPLISQLLTMINDKIIVN